MIRRDRTSRRKTRESSHERHPALRGPKRHLQPFLEYLQIECGLAKNTVDAYRSDLNKFLDWYSVHGPETLKDVELKLLTSYLQHLHERRLAATSIARHLVSIKMFFRFLVLEGILIESVAELMSSPKLWQHLPKVISPEKIEQLLVAPAPLDRYPLRDRAILAVMYATGCRASEVTGLDLRDVHLEEEFCRCTGKGNKERLVSLNGVAISALEAYLDAERPKLSRQKSQADDPLFVTRSGRRMSRIAVWDLVKKYAARVGCSSEVSPHTLRHSFATHMLANGAEIRALQELLGHANIATTQVYTHVDHSRLKSVHQKFHPRG